MRYDARAGGHGSVVDALPKVGQFCSAGSRSSFQRALTVRNAPAVEANSCLNRPGFVGDSPLNPGRVKRA